MAHVADYPALKACVCCEGYALSRLAYVYGARDLVVAAVGWVLVV